MLAVMIMVAFGDVEYCHARPFLQSLTNTTLNSRNP